MYKYVVLILHLDGNKVNAVCQFVSTYLLSLGAQTSLSIAVQTTENKKKPICFRKFGVGKLL